MRLDSEISGMVVYMRGTDRRGKIDKIVHNRFTGVGTLTVTWDDGKTSTHAVTELMSEKLYNEERLDKMSIKKEDCTVGKVVYLSGVYPPLSKGKIVGPPNDKNLVIVEWEGGHLEKKDRSKLLDEKTGAAENQRLVDEKERLEKEFEQVEVECKNKLQQAANLIYEASKLAGSKGKELQDMYDAVSPLERAMDAAGWSTSSWHC